MKKTLLTLIGLAAFTLAAVSLPAQTPLAAAVTVISGGTNNAPATTTVTYAGSLPVIDVSYQKDFGYAFYFLGSGAGTGNLDINLSTGVDGITWKTNATSIRTAANGAAGVVAVGSINNAGVPFYRIESIVNTNSISFTNLTFKYCGRMAVP